MKKNIAVEPDLTPVRDFLKGKGYNVESIDYGEYTSKKTDRFDAYIVTGMGRNFLGVADTGTRAIVIDATGMSPEQVHRELENRLE